jgi:hypothetical protein
MPPHRVQNSLPTDKYEYILTGKSDRDVKRVRPLCPFDGCGINFRHALVISLVEWVLVLLLLLTLGGQLPCCCGGCCVSLWLWKIKEKWWLEGGWADI